jgi:hypothetical protein
MLLLLHQCYNALDAAVLLFEWCSVPVQHCIAVSSFVLPRLQVGACNHTLASDEVLCSGQVCPLSSMYVTTQWTQEAG